MNLLRQEDMLPQKAIEKSFGTIIGAGAIGSWLAMDITKMGVPKIRVYDNDVVDVFNPSSQNYRPRIDEGKLKVLALKEIVEMFTTAEVEAIPELFTGDPSLSGIVMSAVDNMESRINIWHSSIKFNPLVPLYIEARMGAEELRVYSVCPTDPEQVERYETYLYPPSVVHHARCSGKAICYTPSMAAAVMARELKAYLSGEPVVFENILGLKSRIWVVQ